MADKGNGAGRRRGVAFFVVIVILGGLIGSVIGELVGHFFSNNELIYKIFTTGIEPGFDPREVDLAVILFTVGVTIKLNVCSALGMVLATYIYRHL